MLRHPFTIGSNARAATVEDDTDSAAAQQIAILLLTKQGERPLIPEYGTPDPTFDLTGTDTVAATVAAFGPDVSVTDVTASPVTDGVSELTITFDR